MSHDAVVIGAGPNGLAAAVVLAQAGHSVLVLEQASVIGGGTRTEELTLPGFRNDVCSAIHPLALASPLFSELPLADHGLEWVDPPAPVAHPLDDGPAVVLERSVEATADSLGDDAAAYRRLVGPLVEAWPRLAPHVLGPLWRLPRHPLTLLRFGLLGVRSARSVARRRFDGLRAKALFGGLAAHAILPLDRPFTASVGLVFATSAHAGGWPFPRGGSQAIADALASYLKTLGGEVRVDHRVESIDDLPTARAYLFDVTPSQLLALAGDRLAQRYQRRLRRFRRGPGVFKIDYALDGPVPWRDQECQRAGTVHLGGTLEEVAAAEQAVARGDHPERPFVLTAQQSLFDATRAPATKHTFWAYCHVPNGSTFDMTERIEDQIERFAPGFRDVVLARSTLGPAALEAHNPNNVGGDIAGGSHRRLQILARPVFSLDPYRTPASGVYLCSSSTPPGAGVHGMCGYHAARSALRHSL